MSDFEQALAKEIARLKERLEHLLGLSSAPARAQRGRPRKRQGASKPGKPKTAAKKPATQEARLSGPQEANGGARRVPRCGPTAFEGEPSEGKNDPAEVGSSGGDRAGEEALWQVAAN